MLGALVGTAKKFGFRIDRPLPTESSRSKNDPGPRLSYSRDTAFSSMHTFVATNLSMSPVRSKFHIFVIKYSCLNLKQHFLCWLMYFYYYCNFDVDDYHILVLVFYIPALSRSMFEMLFYFC